MSREERISFVNPSLPPSVPQAFGQIPSPQRDILYVLAPNGSVEVQGSPGLFAVPQGQTMSLAPSSYGGNAVVPLSYPRTLSLVSLVLYLLGIFYTPCQLPSIVLSLHMCRKGYIRKKKAVVIAMSVMELIGWIVMTIAPWIGLTGCYNSYYYNCLYIWGIYTFVLYSIWEIAFGIPRVVFACRYDSEVEHISEQMPTRNIQYNTATGYQTL